MNYPRNLGGSYDRYLLHPMDRSFMEREAHSVQKPPEQILSWFAEHQDQKLRIEKSEDGDLDVCTIKLEAIQVVEHRDAEGYLSPQALLLKGKGTVNTAQGKEPLPGEGFEIPLTGRWCSAADRRTLHLSTERGSYRIESAEG